ncbi:MAG: PCRF domain-containing protein [Oscillibacter sp.]|nr:PCRF domain-containing protein [Oscillibacter sp.]
MLEKLKELALRQEDLEARLADPSVYGDGKRLAAIQRELKELTPVVEAAGALEAAERRREEAEALLRDPELKALAQEELAAAKAEAERRREELKRLLLPRDPNDGRNAVLEIRAGVGGEEAALFAGELR